MKGLFIIQLSDGDGDSAQWLRMEPGQDGGRISRGSLKDAASQTVGCRVVALVPSTDVLLAHVNVPTQNRQRMLKAIPYALEEQIVGDVDELHVAVGPRNGDGEVATLVVSREAMDRWQARLREAGLQADVMTPDLFALPANEEAWSVMQGDAHALVRTGRDTGFGSDPDNVQPILGLAVREAGEARPARLHAFQCDGSAALDLGAFDEIEVETEPCEGGLLSVIASHGFDAQSAINLLQGDYSRREQLGKLWRPWRLPAALLGAWLLVQLGVAIGDQIQLGEENEALKAEVEKIYRAAFPDARRVVNARAQMEQALKELQSGGSGGAGFLEMLGKAGPALAGVDGVELQSIRFKRGTLDIELQVPSLQTLDQLKTRLTEGGGLSVEIQSAAARGDQVQGRLQIKSVGS